MSTSSSSSSSSGSSSSYTLPPGTSINAPCSVSTTLTDADIGNMFPGFEFVDSPSPDDHVPPPPDSTWGLLGNFIADGIVMWVYKKLGWLLILEALENGGETPERY